MSAVYGALNLQRLALALACALGISGAAAQEAAPSPKPELIGEAREALRLKDKKRLAGVNTLAQAQQYPLAAWIDYWDLGLRLTELSQADLEGFYARWPGSYVEDRLRNDWLLELGRRRDWGNFARELPRFKMADDREVACYGLLTEHLAGRDVRAAARAAWLAQKDGDDGCQLLASTMLEAKLLKPEDVWLKLRLSFELNRPRAIKQASALLPKGLALQVGELQDHTARYLARKASVLGRSHAELSTLALLRLGASDTGQAAELLGQWEARLPQDLAAWAWAQLGRQAGFKLLPEAADYYARAFRLLDSKHQGAAEWSDDTLGWAVRAALRADMGAGRPALALQALGLMSAKEQQETAWQYWRARALQAAAADGPKGEPQRAQARQLLQGLASPLSFYGKLAADELEQRLPLPPAPAALTPMEKGLASVHPGLNRSLLLIAAGLRNEGVREWNYSLRGMSDRELLAAAALACEREIWDRCINTSERTKAEVDLSQRYPLPFRNEVLAKAREIGLDPAYVYGLIRQESRFIMDARSHVGASGLMQVMPATARWTAKKAGLDYKPEYLTDRDFNLRIGTNYLKLVLDDFGGSMAMAAAAYNAGPGRPRRWREGPVIDAALWAESIPFNETRDYVKKVLSNATVYARLLGAEPSALRERLGKLIGPREASAPSSNQELP
ncbi:lytic transglycosylase domain-containing protein [Paucibacter soli]|uniref:lytic transglycosylase domain-containing protein n=1 Tax=Paucibacter soli TaxID=3133433 RepID=UPI0030AB9408